MGMIAVQDNIHFETAPDGTRIRIGFWPSVAATRRGRVALIHGRTEFLEKYAETIADLGARGFDVWSMDWRGQGLSDRMTDNPQRGHIDRFETYISDLVWFMDRIVGADPRHGPDDPTIMLAHSMGGHVVMRALLEGRLAPDGAVLTAPMFDLTLPRSARPFAKLIVNVAVAAGLAARYAPGMEDYDPRKARFENNPLTGDAARFDIYQAALRQTPALALGGVTYGWLKAALASIEALDASAKSAPATCPVLVCTAAADRVVSNDAQAKICSRLSSALQVILEDARHEILIETDPVRARFWSLLDDFVDELKP